LWSDKNGNLVKIGFNKSIQDTPLHFTGIRLLHPNILKFTPNKKNQSLFPDIIQPSLNQGKEYNLYKSSLLWQELGNPLDLKNSENLMKKILNHSCDYNSELIYTLEKSEFNQSALYFKKQISDYLNFFR
jgi:NDP-sugar pyrophosphorylase family protein